MSSRSFSLLSAGIRSFRHHFEFTRRNLLHARQALSAAVKFPAPNPELLRQSNETKASSSYFHRVIIALVFVSAHEEEIIINTLDPRFLTAHPGAAKSP